MKFVLIDRIVALESGRRIVAEKSLSLAEEYLAEHFPTFPVLPGVLMLEAMTQASAWVVRERTDFAPSLVLLKEARNVTYKSFLSPGCVLTVESECTDWSDQTSDFLARGRVGEREIVKGRLTLRRLSLSEAGADWASVDHALRAEQRALFRLLWRPSAAPGAPAASSMQTVSSGR